MVVYYILLIFSLSCLVVIFIRKRDSAGGFQVYSKSRKYFLKHFSRNKNGGISLSIENAGSAATHCPAAVLKDESFKPTLDKDDAKAMRACFVKAENAMKKEDFNEAERGYIKVLAFDENHVEANLKLGFIYLKKGLAVKAEAMFKKLINLNCADAVIFSNLGNALFQQQKFSDACEMYLKAIELDPTNSRRYLNLGRVLHEMGNFDGAIEYIAKAISLDNNAEFLAAMADVYISLGNFERAQEFVGQALKADKKSPVARIISKKLKAKKKASANP